jgi:hypothetical protein
MRAFSALQVYIFLSCLTLSASLMQATIPSATSFPNLSPQSATIWEEIRAQIMAGKPVGFSDLPLINKIPLDDTIKGFLNGIVINAPWVEVYDAGIALKGNVELFGTPVDTMLYFAFDNAEGNISLYVVIPNMIKISRIVPVLGFLDSLIPPFTVFVLSSSNYTFEQFNVSLKPGLNLLTMFKFSGPLEVLNKLFGKRLNEVEVYGVINPSIVGTSFKGVLPGTIKFGSEAGGIETTGLVLKLEVEQPSIAAPVYVPAFSIQSGFKVIWPGVLKEPQLFAGALKITPLKGEIWGKTEGKLYLPSLPGAQVCVEEARLTVEVDWAQLAASSGIIPISGGGFQGRIKLNPEDPQTSKTLEAAVKVAVTSAGGLGDFMLVAKMDGELSLEEIIDWGVLQIKQASQALGHSLNLKLLEVPRLLLRNPYIEIVPKTMMLADKRYEQKIECGAEFEALNAVGVIDFHISKERIEGLGFLSDVTIGPLKITGYSPNEKGARVHVLLDANQQFFQLSGKLVLDILGGISSETLIILLSNGLFCKTTTKLFGHYETDLEIKADTLQHPSEDNFYLKGHMKQSLLLFLEDEIKKFAQEILPHFSREAQREFNRVENEIGRINRELFNEWGKCRAAGWPDSSCSLFWNEIVRRNFEIGGLHLYREILLKPGVPLAHEVLKKFSELAACAATILGQGLNIEEFVFEGRLDEFSREAKLPKVTIRMKFLGRTVEMHDLQVNMSNIRGSVEHIFNQLGKLFMEQDKPYTPLQAPIKLNVPIRIGSKMQNLCDNYLCSLGYM